MRFAIALLDADLNEISGKGYHRKLVHEGENELNYEVESAWPDFAATALYRMITDERASIWVRIKVTPLNSWRDDAGKPMNIKLRPGDKIRIKYGLDLYRKSDERDA